MLADGFQFPAAAGAGRLAVAIHRQPQFPPEPFRQALGGLDASVPAGAIQRHDRNHVQRSDPGMATAMAPQVDGTDRNFRHRQDSPFNPRQGAREGEYGAVMVDVAMPIEKRDVR